MRIGIPVCNGRVSPVYDAARSLMVVTAENGSELRRTEAIDEKSLDCRAKRTMDLGLDVLICGAISRELEVLLEGANIRVISQTCGPVEEVLKAFCTDRLTDDAFLMPGCRAHRCGGNGPPGGRRRRSHGQEGRCP